MWTALLICLLLTWSPIFLYQIIHRPFLVLLVWLFIGPVASNFISAPGTNPFFVTPKPISQKLEEPFKENNAYLTAPQTFKLSMLFEPTRVLFSLLLSFFLLGAFLRTRYLAPLDRTERWMCIFCFISLLNVLLQSWRLNFGLHVVIDSFIIPFLSYYLARRLVTSEERFCQLTKALGYMGFYLIVIGLFEYWAYQSLGHRLSGPFWHRDPFYIVMMTIFFMVLFDFLSSRDLPRVKWALPRGVRWFVLYLAPVMIFLTLTRGNWLGFILGMWVFLFMGRRLIESHQKLRATGLALILIPIAIIGVRAFLPPEFLPEEISTRAIDPGTVEHRFRTWGIAIHAGLQSPIFGIGLNNLRNVLATLGHQTTLRTVHNCFLAFFAELGAVGLLTYLAIIASIIRTALNLYCKGVHSQDRWRGVEIIAIMVAYLTPALTETILYVETVHIYVFACIGGIAGVYSSNRLGSGLTRDI